jgi:hypothetical protein
MYRTAAELELEGGGGLGAASTVVALAGVLNSLRDDYGAGYLATVEELIHRDLFADFIEMAEELVAKGYKDPAAVILGSVLEEHLRKLGLRHGVSDIRADGKPKKADMLNADAVKAGVYEKLDQKQVTAWLDLRNKAAHARYEEYTEAQVELMLQGLRDFLIRHPA